MLSTGTNPGAMDGAIWILALAALFVCIALWAVISCACCQRQGHKSIRSAPSNIPNEILVLPPPVPESPEQKVSHSIKGKLENSGVQPEPKVQDGSTIRAWQSKTAQSRAIESTKVNDKPILPSQSETSTTSFSSRQQHPILVESPPKSKPKKLDDPVVHKYIDMYELTGARHESDLNNDNDLTKRPDQPLHARIPVPTLGISGSDKGYRTIPNDVEFVESHRSVTMNHEDDITNNPSISVIKL